MLLRLWQTLATCRTIQSFPRGAHRRQLVLLHRHPVLGVPVSDLELFSPAGPITCPHADRDSVYHTQCPDTTPFSSFQYHRPELRPRPRSHRGVEWAWQPHCSPVGPCQNVASAGRRWKSASKLRRVLASSSQRFVCAGVRPKPVCGADGTEGDRADRDSVPRDDTVHNK